MSAATDDPTGIPIPSNRTYITERQVKEWEGEIENLERVLGDPKARLQDRGGITQSLRRMKADLERETPPETTPQQREALAREERRLLDEILPEMCSQQEMRKNPPGAVGKYRRGEASPATKAMILRWKNVVRILNKGNDDPDIANLERYRHRNSTLGMENAQVPGKDIFPSPNTEAYKEGYERTFGGEEAKAADVEELQLRLDDALRRLDALDTKPTNGKGVSAKPEAVADDKKFVAIAPCGKKCFGRTQGYADNGMRSHARSKACCKDATAQGG